MPRSRRLPLILGSAIGVILPVLLVATASPASARKVDGGTFHEERTFIDSNFCGVTGLAVEGHLTLDGRYLVRAQGPDGILYFMENTRQVLEWTNLATGQTATEIQPRTLTKDLKITVNADGTLTIIALLTGGGRLYGDDGDFIAKGSGQVRFRNVVNYNGTLTDPSDDIEVSSELIFGSTGTNDDYCAAILEDWGVTA